MRYLTVPLLLMLVASSSALDPPVKLWEKEYYDNWDSAKFWDVELNQDEDLFITGLVYSWTNPSRENYVAFLLDLDGNVIWEVPHEYYGETGYDGVVLPDGSYVITGSATEDSTSSSVGLTIHKISPDGETVWSRIYDYPETKEEGYGITSLPDGGFAVCGRVHGTGFGAGDSWLLRTDALGDTLWTDVWGTAITNRGYDITFNNNEICLLALGEDDTLTTYGTHLLFYSPEGEYLRGTTESITTEPASICIASDGGYTFTNTVFPRVWHTDQYGNLLWWKDIYVTINDWHKGYCIRTTMDSGYIFCGWDGYYEYEPDGRLVDYQEGWLARFDSEGNELWNINNTISVNHHYYSCLQLPEGGYIACGAYNVFENMDAPTTSRGSTGFLVRYAPETGISEPDPSGSMNLEVFPNPCSSMLSVDFSQPESGHASVQVYDLSGRLVSTVVDGEFPAGNNTITWSVPEGVSSGCYMVHLETGQNTVNENLVLLR